MSVTDAQGLRLPVGGSGGIGVGVATRLSVRRMRSFALSARALGALAVTAAAAPLVACAPSLSANVPQADTAQLARCHVGASQSRPFVTEWPATERSRLESKMASGLVVVTYSGCEMQVLDRCRVEGGYRFVPTSVATDGFSITTDDELYAKLPLGAASLEGELARSGKLDLRYAVVGQYEARDADPAKLALSGECGAATHVVTGYAVGAFALTSTSKDTVGGGVSVPVVGAGAKHARGEATIRASGGIEACTAVGTGPSPPAECRTPIQLFLAALPGRAGAAGQAGGGAARGSGPGATAEGSGGDATAGASGGDAIPSVRGLLYLGGGLFGGGAPLAGKSAWAGPMGTGALGLRARPSDDLELQLRGFAGVGGDFNNDVALIPLGLDASLRIRPKTWAFYAGGGGGGSLTLIPTHDPYVLWHGLLELGFVLGAAERWDVGVRGGAGSTFTDKLPALYEASLVVGYAFY